jgi:hypothetical protein
MYFVIQITLFSNKLFAKSYFDMFFPKNITKIFFSDFLRISATFELRNFNPFAFIKFYFLLNLSNILPKSL